MTPFYYYALFLTLGLFLYYVVLIAMTMYGKPKGEDGTAENIETDGVSEDNNQVEEPGNDDETTSDDNDDESGSREWQEGDDDGENNNEEPSNDDLPPFTNEGDDNKENANEAEPPYEEPEQNTDVPDSDTPTTEDDNDDIPSATEEVGNEDQNEVAQSQSDGQSEESNESIDDSALGLTPALREYLKQHGAVIENTVKKVDDLDLTPPEEGTDYGVTEIHEPDNEDAQIIAAQANSCQEKITPKSDDEIPKGALNKMLGERLTKALEDDDETIPNNNTANNILSHNVRDRC